ncbi:hypothetical protein SSPO_009990 [Streptomyces antimycoticus]|uniref:Uncharacterized protein n=1 Tax=Streptomyces antimycoticus TaxID=68175 RepID=A0A499UMJ6_9ACTN|nr:hypothetical protein SSPO_009990 [Streptomyces antimycoticus]
MVTAHATSEGPQSAWSVEPDLGKPDLEGQVFVAAVAQERGQAAGTCRAQSGPAFAQVGQELAFGVREVLGATPGRTG